MAVFLLRLVCRWNELGTDNFELRYIRNQQGHVIDFVIIKDLKPLALFEAKKGNITISKSGTFFSKLLEIPYYQLVADRDIIEAFPDHRYILSAWRSLPLFG